MTDRDSPRLYDTLRLDVINLAVSCNLLVEDASAPKSIVNDVKTRHLALIRQNARKDTIVSHAFKVAQSLLEAIPAARVSCPSRTKAPATLEETLEILTTRVSDVVRDSRQVLTEEGLVDAIADLVIAAGGAEIPSSFSELPRAIEDVKHALVDKNTTIVRLESRLHAAEVDLDEAHLLSLVPRLQVTVFPDSIV